MSNILSRHTRRLAARLFRQNCRKAQAGFTLLELLVVVAILAAVAGTATIVLQDTDRRASAAAHVAMMDELKKGVATFAVLRSGQLPDNYDSLLQGTTGAALFDRLAETTAAMLNVGTVPVGVTGLLNTSGITTLRVIDGTAKPYESGAPVAGLCAAGDVIRATVNNPSYDTVISNIYNDPLAHGCGAAYTIADGGNAAFWIGGQKRVLGGVEPELGTGGLELAATLPTAPSVAGARLLLAVGFGQSSTLFDGKIGSLSTVPTYRHTAKDEYNRFIGLYAVADGGLSNSNGTNPLATATAAWTPIAPELVAVVDGAGDTKDEELGEFDGTRSTL